MIARRVTVFCLLCIPLLTLAGCGPREAARMIETLPAPAGLTPLIPEQWKLSNGLEVLFIKDEEVPIVRGTLYIPGGSLWEQRPGILEAMGVAMRQGGAGALSADELERQLEVLAASVSSGFGPEFGTASFSCLSSDLPRVLGIFGDVVLRPRFEQQRLDLWRGQVLEGIRRRREDPDTIASLAFQELLYPRVAYGRVLTSADILNISRAGLVEAHRRFVRPDQAILAISGKIERPELERLTREVLGTWEKRGSLIPPPPPVPYAPAPAVYFIEQPFTQATILVGQQGVPRLTHDYIAIDAFNRLFGGSGFGSRLVARVRSDLGLAYSIYGVISPGVVKGQNVIGLQTKSQSAGTALLESLKVLRELQQKTPERDELEERKLAAENSFVFKLASTDSQAQRRAVQTIWRYPRDYDATYIPKMKAVTPEDVHRVALERWDISKCIVVVVGNGEARESLVELLNQRPALLEGFQLRPVGFEEKLVL